MSDFLLNLASEGIGVTTELVVVYFIVDFILKRREKQRWQPARFAIVKQAATAYSHLFATAHMVLRLDIPGNTKEEKYQFLNVYLNMANYRLQRLQKTIDLNNAALDSYLMPLMSVLLDECEALFDKAKYFSLVFSPKHANFDFISEPPYKEVESIQKVIDELKKKYKDIFLDRKNVPDGIKTSFQLKQIWTETEKKLPNLSFDFTEFVLKPGRIPMVYDRDSLMKIKIKNIKPGQPIQVFNTII